MLKLKTIAFWSIFLWCLTFVICHAQSAPQRYNQGNVVGVIAVTPLPTYTPSVTFTFTPTNTPQNTPAAGTNTWTPTFTNTPTATPTITGTPTQTNTPGNVGLLNATGANDNWKDAAPFGTSTPGIGAVYDNPNAKDWALSLQSTNNICVDQNGNTCTPTPTGSPTGTPTSTPTPNGVMVFSADVLAPVTIFFPRPINGFSFNIDLNNANATPCTWFVYGGSLTADQFNGATLQTGSAQHLQGALGMLTGTTVSAFVTGALYGATHLVFAPAITPTRTEVATFVIQLTWTNAWLPKQYRHLFERDKDYNANDPYSEGHQYSVYYKGGRPVKVHSWG